MSIEKPFANNTLATYIYEPFSYTISNPGSYTLTTSNTPGIPPGYLVNNGTEVVFSTPSNGMNSGTELFVITAKSGDTVVGTSSNTVTIGAGRFLDASGSGYDGRSFAFFKNEPITPIPLVAPFAMSAPTSVPTLPPGLSYVSNASNIYSISGTPLVTVPQSNYLLIGKGSGSNLGKIVTSQFGMSVSNERVLMNLAGSDIVSPMTIGTPISQRVITAQYPPYPSGGTLRYSWFGLPDGITVADASGNTQGSPFTPSDSLSTLVVRGTPTVAAANAYRNAGITSNLVTFTGTRTNPLPQISNSIPITFGFGETVLFDAVTVPTLYSGVAVDPSATSFFAKTYFGSGSPITTMFSPDLRADLSLTAVSNGRAYLKSIAEGPGATGTSTYTIRAINSSNVSQDLLVPITVAADSVTFISPTPNPLDACYNFVLSRPLAASIPGYYSSNIQFRANAASGNAVTFSTANFAGTGLSLSNVGSNTVQIVGTPETVTSLTTATITANVVGTPATASTTFKFSILPDSITFSQPTPSQLAFVQNRPITPIQLTATTLSERQVISFTSSNLPAGLTLSTTGLITGTPVDSTGTSFSVTASTGFTSQSHTYSYTLTADSLLFLLPQTSYTYLPLSTVSIPIDGLTYSGSALSNYVFSGFSPTYGLSIDSSLGVISGTLIEGLPPGQLYPIDPVSFTITANAGLLNGSLPSTLTVTNPVIQRSFLLVAAPPDIINPVFYVNNDQTWSNWLPQATEGGTSLILKNTTVDSNVYLMGTGMNRYRRSTDGVNWSTLPFVQSNDSNAGMLDGDTGYTFQYSSNTATWIAAGTREVTDYPLEIFPTLAVFASTDDGLTWRFRNTIRVSPRRFQSIPNYFNYNGVAFGSKNGTLMIGGGQNLSAPGEYFVGSTLMQWSGDGGFSWNPVKRGDFEVEVATFELNGPVWIAAGSTHYSSGSNYEAFGSVASTLKWSENNGLDWYDCIHDFNVTATQVVYAGGRWLATGLNAGPPATVQGVVTDLKYSVDGLDWFSITLPGVTFTNLSGNPMPLPEVHSIWFDDTNWYVFIRISDSYSSYQASIFQHSLTGDLTTGWTEKASSIDIVQGYAHTFRTNYIRLGQPTTITLAFDTVAPGGPTFTSPTQTSYTLYQYTAMSPITFEATGADTVYYFVDSAQLPRGITFDPVTATLSGTSMLLGQETFTVYAKDSVGVSRLVITMTTIIPYVQRQQTSAGAWTSLVRQYTVVNAAQNSVNGKTLPATEPPLGEFMRPQPPDSVSATGDPNCVKKC